MPKENLVAFFSDFCNSWLKEIILKEILVAKWLEYSLSDYETWV